MAVDPDLVDAIAAGVADIYRDAEAALIRTIRTHLDRGLDNPAAERRAATLRSLRRAAQSIVAALEADSGPAIRDALSRSYRHGWSSALAGLPRRHFPQSGIGDAAAAALRERSGAGFVEALVMALFRDFGHVTRSILRDVVGVYRDVQAAAAGRILTGAQTRRQAAQSAWQAWIDRGVSGFTDRAGRRWKLSSYAEMATRTVAQRAAVQGQVDRLDTIGVELVYVSDAVQECARCRPFEGRILRTTPGPLDVQVEHATRDGVMVTVEAYATLDDARLRGLFHPNCRHSISAYLPGVTRVPKGRPDPDGDKARQQQRALERRIRKYKEQQLGALTDQARADAGRRVRAAQAALRAHLAANPGLKRLPYRERIGAGNMPPPGRGPEGGPVAPLGPPSEPTLDGGPAPAPPSRTRRIPPEEPPVEDRQPGPGQDRLDRPDPAHMSDTDLETALMDEMARPDFDQGWIDRLAREMDRREAEQQAREEARARNRERARARREQRDAERAQRIQDLLDDGWPEEEAVAEVLGTSVERQRRARAIAELRSEGYTGKGFEDLARQAYKDYVYRAWLAAEDATRGQLVTREGQAQGIDPASLFYGSEARARRWASDELKAWWDEHGRLSFADFKDQLLGRRGEQGGRDFLS